MKDIHQEIKQRIFTVQSPEEFNALALEIFQFQYKNNPVYNEFTRLMLSRSGPVEYVSQIPFLPVGFFKSHTVQTGRGKVEKIFCSSGTTSSTRSSHHLTDLDLYLQSLRNGFSYFYDGADGYCIMALLPSPAEHPDSSLAFMADALIRESGCIDSGFYLSRPQHLAGVLKRYSKTSHKALLIGLTYALLDFLHTSRFDFPDLIVMETGGMKGRRKEMTREELHNLLCAGFGVNKIHSEYGMTELLSQAYSKGDGLFRSPHWMKILIRDINDPLSLVEDGKTGGINIIDLANIYSCSFIATQDLGRINPDGTFEVLGRFDASDIRGCNLLWPK